MEELDPKQTNRAEAFQLWMRAPMPMVTLVKALDVTRPARLSRRGDLKFNLLLCWCIGKAASRVEEFYTLPVGEKLIRYENLAVNTVASLRDGGIATCDVPFSESLDQFRRDYLALTAQVRETGAPYDLNGDYMVIGTSALPQTEIDGAVNIYAGCYNNPFLVWGKYRKKLWRVSLPISFQFHHTQMDGGHAARFLENLQEEIRALNP
ncbi:CatA-like O-acetyltransferase, family 2 [uncultured Oscillibacter sp.]|uniref:CatA-like O-acetyltransferase, family 2 n=1 Tax=uncultured Oscillibacter sp. TaxID=876091 RepID=UPI002634A757|nr:CatA-like O-acetyltransferase, family 2 [uncultured Oscillibacter sp.]